MDLKQKKDRRRIESIFEEELAILVLLRSPRIIQVHPPSAARGSHSASAIADGHVHWAGIADGYVRWAGMDVAGTRNEPPRPGAFQRRHTAYITLMLP